MSLPWLRGGKFDSSRSRALAVEIQAAGDMAGKQGGDLLGMLQKSARNGTLLSSCEPEIRELMHQIDVLISAKQQELAGRWKGLETQLREKERELAAVRHTLWQKDTELGQVSEKYEQLKARRQHKQSSSQSVSVRKTAEEIHQLRREKQVLEEARAQLQEQQTVLDAQLNLTKLETTALQEKCTALEGEVKFCRSQLDQKDSLLAAIEQSNSVRTKQLQAQLRRSQEQAESKDLTLQKVRGECEERKKEAEAASAEVLSLNSQLSQSQASVRQLRGRYAELQNQVQKLEDQLKVTGTQLNQKEHSMKLLQESSQRKDKLIKSLGGRQGQGSELNRLKQELGHAQSQLQTHSQRERELRNELATLRQRSAADGQELARLTANCATQDEKFAQELASLRQKHSSEVKELRSQVSKVGRDKALALEQMEAECEERLAKQQQLLEERLKAATNRPTATLRTPTDSSRTEKMTTQPLSLLSTAQHTTNNYLPTPIPIQMKGPSPAPHTAPPSSAIIGKFLQEADRISHTSPPQPQTLFRPTDTEKVVHSGLQFEYQSQEDIVSGSLPFPLAMTGDSGLGGFVPLQPVGQSERDNRGNSAPDESLVSSAVGSVGEGGWGNSGGGEGEGGIVEGEGGTSEPPQDLEEMFSKTLDSIVDRHFQQLDSSLMKLMSKDS